jgi:hypothetical protein
MKHLGYCPHDPRHDIDDLEKCQEEGEVVIVEWSEIANLAERHARFTTETLEAAYNTAIAEGNRELWVLVQKETT